MASEIERAIDAVWRIESAKLIAGVARIVRDVGVAEDVAQDALVTALERWPQTGIPDRPGAWLAAVARMRAIDVIRRNDRLHDKHAEVARELEHATGDGDPSEYEPDQIEDDLLRLIFIACHPVLSTDARVALTLRLLGGLTTEEIARAFLAPVATVAQRIVRAKRTLAEAQVPFELPPPAERATRLASVLEVIYLDFQRGLLGNGRRRLDAPRVVRGRAAARPRPRGAHARPSRKCTDSLRSWSSRRRVCAPGAARRARRFCCSTRIARAGTVC